MFFFLFSSSKLFLAISLSALRFLFAPYSSAEQRSLHAKGDLEMSTKTVDLQVAPRSLWFLIDWREVTVVTCVFVPLHWSPGRAAPTWNWVKFQAFSHISNRPAFSLSLLQLISHLMCARGLCQAHWQWKNNLTGFNLFLPPPSLPPFLSFSFVCVWEVWNSSCLVTAMHRRNWRCKLDPLSRPHQDLQSGHECLWNPADSERKKKHVFPFSP